MKRRTVLITALFLIGIVTGIAISQLISNTTNFSVWVDGTAPLYVEKMSQPSGVIYQDQWYNDVILLNVSNKDANQGYSFYLFIEVKTTTSGNTLDPSSVNMQITSSTDNQATFGNLRTIVFQQGSTANTINGTYLYSQTITIDAYNGGQWQDFFLISFEVTSAMSGNYVFSFSANV